MCVIIYLSHESIKYRQVYKAEKGERQSERNNEDKNMGSVVDRLTTHCFSRSTQKKGNKSRVYV